MNRCRILSAVVALLLVSLSLYAGELAPASSAASVNAPKKLRLLFLTQSSGFRHDVVTRPSGKPEELSLAEKALSDIGARSGVFQTECSQDATQLTAEKLKSLDALVFFTSGDLPLPPARVNAIMEWARKGGAIVGIHSATDTFKEFRAFYEVMGATFLRHPWNHGATLSRLDTTHPAVAMFQDNFKWNDEICEYHYFDPKKVRVLMSVDMSHSSPTLAHAVPVVWVREYGKGRVFYTNLGHSEAAWSTELFRKHLLAGIRWAGKLDEGSAEPNPDTMKHEDEKARLAVLEHDKSWLSKAALSVGNDPARVLQFAEICARENASAFVKLNDAVIDASADEKARAAKLKPGQKPTEADQDVVFRRRLEIIHSLIPAEPPKTAKK